MVTVTPEKDKNKVKEIYEKAGLAFADNSECVVARDGEETLGACLFSIEGDTVTVHGVSPADDILMADGVLRSALYVASMRFIFKARCDNDEIMPLLEKLGFIKDKETRAVDIDKLFRGCGCEEK